MFHYRESYHAAHSALIRRTLPAGKIRSLCARAIIDLPRDCRRKELYHMYFISMPGKGEK